MSKLEELKGRQKELGERLEGLSERAEEWREKKAEAEAELERAILEGDATYKRTIHVHEAELALETIGKKIAEYESELKEARAAQAELEYDHGYSELSQMRQETLQAMAEVADELQAEMDEAWEKQVDLVADYNEEVHKFSQVANRVGRPSQDYIKSLRDIGKFEWVMDLLKDELGGGSAGSARTTTMMPRSNRNS